MDEKDRLALILFNRKASIYFNLEYITKERKNLLKTEIDEIYTNRGTNILSGLEKAIEILKKEKNEVNINRVFSVLLLSDGCDTYNNEIQLANSLKEMTKGFDLSFTLHTFGYGYYYDEKVMNKLANLRDGSFYFVENYSKVSEYFACVLGGCMSVISEKAEIKVNLLNKNCKIIKIFGGENLYEYELKDELFITKILQFMCGKEYTFVLEINIDENNIKVGDELLDIKFIYEDNSTIKGEIINEKLNGPCIFRNSNKTIFEGYYINNIPNGFGIYKTDNANFYGNWKENDLNGIGEIIWKDTSFYQGEFLNHMKHGIGTYQWPDGTTYQGEFCYNKMQDLRVSKENEINFQQKYSKDLVLRLNSLEERVKTLSNKIEELN